MADQNFIDYVKIFLRSGSGGPGSVHFYRDARTAKGGPDGGDGGSGGDITLVGNRNLWTLLPFRYRKHIFAGNGMTGGGNNRYGSDGESIRLDVPLGTIVKDIDSGQQLAEITKHGEEQILLRGGRGGQGNSKFKHSTNQTPMYAQPGELGIEGWFVFELKVLADVGLVGFPNAGKSTLLSVVSAAKPKIANYTFTTLVPNLGIVSYRDGHSFVMADIPGIIEDAHLGKGLGVRFLRHIERNATLLFLIPCDSDNIFEEYNVLLNELKMYNPELLDKPRILGLSKSDIIDDELKTLISSELPEGLQHIYFSSVTGQGIQDLKDKIWQHVSKNQDKSTESI
jgi:GTP-binding protein